MYPVTQDFLDKMKADRRQVIAKAQIDYTDPYMDQSVEVEANENANASYPAQTADSVETPGKKWASLDGSCMPGDGWWPAPGMPNRGQMGWWGETLAGAGGAFSSPYPTLIITHLPRPARSLKVVGDDMRREYPVDFDINLYAEDGTLLKTVTVTGNDAVTWAQPLDPWVLDVARQELIVKRWSHAGRQVKILEFFTSIQEIYEVGDLVSIKLLEEREASQGSLPVGNVSANEIVLALNNEDGKFDVDNEMSPLANLLKANRRIRAWLGTEVQIPFIHEEDGEDFEEGELDGVVAGEEGLELEEVESPTFTRASKAYLSDGTEVDAGAPRFEQGKFDKALLVEEGTENKIATPTTFAGWANLSGGAVLDNDGSFYPSQAKFARVTTTTWGFQSNSIPAASGQTWSVSYIARRGTGDGEPKAAIMIMNPNDSHVSNIQPSFSSKDIRNGWVRHEATFTIYRADTGYIRLRFYVTATNGGYHDFALPQLEQKPYATTFADGTRSPETLTIPTAGVLNPQEGAIAVIANEHDAVDEWAYVFDTNNSSKRFYLAKNGSNYRISAGTEISGSTTQIEVAAPSSGPHALVVRWEGDKLALFIDGVKESEVTLDGNISFDDITTLYLGCRYSATRHWNSWLDDLAIFDYAPTDEEIQAWYEADAPVPITEHTTYLLRFDNDFVVGKGGARKSLPLDLSSIGTVKTSGISWQATEPTGTSITIETALSTDGGQTWGAWQTATKGQAIPGILPDMDLSNTRLKTRATLKTTDTNITPKLHSLKIEIYDHDSEITEEAYVPLGTFWSLDWDSPDDTLEATVTARDRMELLRKSIYETSHLWVNENLYNIATFVLQDAGLYPGEWVIDPSLQNIVIPYAWFEPISHRDALRLIAEAGLATAYADRDGKIRIVSFKTTSETSELTITDDDYFPPLSAPSKQEGVANEIVVTTQPIEPATAPEEVYKSSEPITVPAKTTQIITVYYSSTPVMDAVPSLVDPPAGVGIDASETVYYAWGAKVAVRNTTSTDQDVIIRVEGKPFKALSKERVAARDEASILDNGVLQYEFPANPLVQTLGQARAIANALLASFKDPRRDIEMTWRGNPALLLGDRITVKGQDYHVIRQEIEWAGALSARLTARKAGD